MEMELREGREYPFDKDDLVIGYLCRIMAIILFSWSKCKWAIELSDREDDWILMVMRPHSKQVVR